MEVRRRGSANTSYTEAPKLVTDIYSYVNDSAAFTRLFYIAASDLISHHILRSMGRWGYRLHLLW
jgi:hypothetical protein